MVTRQRLIKLDAWSLGSQRDVHGDDRGGASRDMQLGQHPLGRRGGVNGTAAGHAPGWPLPGSDRAGREEARHEEGSAEDGAHACSRISLRGPVLTTSGVRWRSVHPGHACSDSKRSGIVSISAAWGRPSDSFTSLDDER